MCVCLSVLSENMGVGGWMAMQRTYIYIYIESNVRFQMQQKEVKKSDNNIED